MPGRRNGGLLILVTVASCSGKTGAIDAGVVHVDAGHADACRPDAAPRPDTRRPDAEALPDGAPLDAARPIDPLVKEAKATLAGLPAIASDGTSVAVAASAGDAWGSLGEWLLIIDVDSDARARVEVAPAQIWPADAEMPAGKAREILAALARKTWRPMTEAKRDCDLGRGTSSCHALAHEECGGAQDLAPPSPPQPRHALGVTVGKTRIEYHEPVLTIDGRPRQVPAWSHRSERAWCRNGAYLGRMFVDATGRVALLRVDYYGDDVCGEPPSEYHVLTF